MNTDEQAWISIGSAQKHSIVCVACGEVIDLKAPAYDHHPSWCPSCHVECVYFEFQDNLVQLVIERSPTAMVRLIRILQSEFDEREFVELLVGFEEIAATLNGKPQMGVILEH